MRLRLRCAAMGNERTSQHYLLRVELENAHCPIWREVSVSSEVTLDWLHEIIQVAMGWEGEHLHLFEFKEAVYVPRGLEEPDFEPEDTVSLGQLLRKAGQHMRYSYDLGDSWNHAIRFVKRIPGDPAIPVALLGGEGACPLEECGGVHGHEEICQTLTARANGDSPDDDRFGDWIPSGYDPEFFDRRATAERLAELGRALLKGISATERPQEGGAEVIPFPPQPVRRDPIRAVVSAMEQEADFLNPYEDLSAEDKAAFLRLLGEAQKVRAAEPWSVLWADNIFVIQDPVTSELDLVSVLGGGGEVYSVQAYFPPQATCFWKRMAMDSRAPDPEETLRMLHMIDVEYCNRSHMDELDFDLYRATRFPKPKGRKPRQWMRFRYYHPRRYPWPPSTRFIHRLERALLLCLRFVEATNEGLVQVKASSAKGGPPTHLPGFRLREGANPQDPDNWVLDQFPIDWSEKPEPQPLPDLSGSRILEIGTYSQSEATWQVGAKVLYEQPVMTNLGPVFLALGLAADQQTGRIEGMAMSENPDAPLGETLVDCVIEAVKRFGFRPSTLQVNSEDDQAALAELAAKTQIRLQRMNKLPAIKEAFSSLREHWL